MRISCALVIPAALCLAMVGRVGAQPAFVTFNDVVVYKIDATNPALDTGNEVCAAVGRTCVGTTDTTANTCLRFHPGASVTSSASGDRTGVYCNGPPQGGVCATLFNTCHTCPACSATVACNQPIGGLYREMFVTCGASLASCDVQMSQPTYLTGETVTVGVFRIRNSAPVPVAVEWASWLELLGVGRLPLINVGANGALFFPAGLDFDLGPLPLLTVPAALPRGGGALGCRLVDPTTKSLLDEDFAEFVVR